MIKLMTGCVTTRTNLFFIRIGRRTLPIKNYWLFPKRFNRDDLLSSFDLLTTANTDSTTDAQTQNPNMPGNVKFAYVGTDMTAIALRLKHY